MMRRLWSEFRVRPVATAVGVGMIPVGIIATALGEGASRAFTLIPIGHGVAHAMGLLLVVGGFLTVAGIVRRDATLEMAGVSFISAGTFIYGAGVIIGLGWNGAIAGGLALMIAVGTFGRVFLLVHAATKLPVQGPQ